MIYSEKIINEKRFKAFLSDVKPGASQENILDGLAEIITPNEDSNEDFEPDYSRFRFSEIQENSHNKSHSKKYHSNKSQSKKFKKAHKKLRKSESSLLKEKLMNQLPSIMTGWLKFKSNYFENNHDFPDLMLPTGPEKYSFDDKYNIVNSAYHDTPDRTAQHINKNYFFARVNKHYLYLNPDDQSLASALVLKLNLVTEVNDLNTNDNCLEVKTASTKNKKNPSFQFCAPTRDELVKWTCLLEKIAKDQPWAKCLEKNDITLPPPKKKVQRQIKQPLIIIPQPQRNCNQNWNYYKNGSDWECMCREGKQQSPIDLPPIKMAVMSPIKPFFDYDVVNSSDEKKLKIHNKNNALRIFANLPELQKARGFGKLVTVDGTVYYAEEIVFHTPAEHTIDGKKFPLEIQVIHTAKSKGDFGKKAVLSFLFEGKPGIYNRFLDDVEFFNLPNPYDKKRVLHNKLYVPNMLLTAEDNPMTIMSPFSFYTYIGSLSSPPCVEQVVWFVGAEPVPASITELDMFKEALRMPDFEDAMGNVTLAKDVPLDNNRAIKHLNGRTVFVYDKNTYNPPTFKVDEEEEKMSKKRGHFEKQVQQVTSYVYVEGQEPSHLPGALVVSEHEAK